MKLVSGLAIATCTIAFAAVPAGAKPKDPAKLGCTQVQGDQCAAWAELTPNQARGVRMNDVFGANYPYYLKVSDLPEDMVREYNLDPRSRYIVTSNGFIFVIDPEGYEVRRVIAPERSTER
jgi:hypothetical protein